MLRFDRLDERKLAYGMEPNVLKRERKVRRKKEHENEHQREEPNVLVLGTWEGRKTQREGRNQ